MFSNQQTGKLFATINPTFPNIKRARCSPRLTPSRTCRGGGTRPGLANGDRHDAALADYAANIMGASSSDSENEDDADGAFS